MIYRDLLTQKLQLYFQIVAKKVFFRNNFTCFERCHTSRNNVTSKRAGNSFSYVEKMYSSKVTVFRLLLLFLLQNLLKIKTKTQKSPFLKNNLKSSDLLLARNCDTSDVFAVLAAAAGLLHDSSVRDYLVFKRGRKKIKWSHSVHN